MYTNRPSSTLTIHMELSEMQETVTVLFSDEVYNPKTMRCVEIGVIAVTGTRLQVAFIGESLRDTDLDLLDVEENIKIYEECKIALREFRKNSDPRITDKLAF